MKRHVTMACVVVLLLTVAFGSVSAQTDWDFESGWVYVTLSQPSSSGVVEYRDSYRVLPDVENRGVRIIYYEEDEEYLLTAEDAFLLKEAFAFLGETAVGEQRQMNGRLWKGFAFTSEVDNMVIGQIELLLPEGDVGHHIFIPTDQMPDFAAAIEAVLNALDK